MPVPASINDLSTVPGSNSPAGSESPGLIDDYLRTHASFIATLRDSGKPLGGTNVKMIVATASATATLTADEVVCKSGTSGWILSAFSKTINLTTVGAGGVDTGTAPLSSYVVLYAIYNPVTATSALLAQAAGALKQPEVYSGSNMPSGYTASALVGAYATNASGQFIVGMIQRRITSFATISILSTTTANGSPTSVSVLPAAPLNAVRVKFRVSIAANSANVVGTSTVGATSTQVGITQSARILPSIGIGDTAEMGWVPIVTPGTAFFTDAVGAGTIGGFVISVTEFEF